MHISKGEFSLAEQFVEEVFTDPDYKETSMKEISLTTIKQGKGIARKRKGNAVVSLPIPCVMPWPLRRNRLDKPSIC